MVKLVLDNVSAKHGAVRVLSAVSCTFAPGEFTIILGANGAGKSSLIKAALGLLPISEGSVTLDEREISSLSPPKRACLVSYLPQNRSLAWPLLVEDMAALGRFAYGASLGRLSASDRAVVDRALSDCQLQKLRRRPATALSGGEQARMHFARVLASEAPLLLVDEPAAALDPQHRFRIMEILQNYAHAGNGAVAVLHDLTLAARYADRLIWMKGGQIIDDGPPSITMNAENIGSCFDVDAQVRTDSGIILVALEPRGG